MKIYKIRHKATGLFSTGGNEPKWTTMGKTWTKLSYVHSHLSQSYLKPDVYNDAEIVESEVILTPIEPANNYRKQKADELIAHWEEQVKRRPDYPYYQEYLERAHGRRALME